MFDQPSSLGSLPQQMSVVVRVVSSPALSGRHPGNRTPVDEEQKHNHDSPKREYKTHFEVRRLRRDIEEKKIIK